MKIRFKSPVIIFMAVLLISLCVSLFQSEAEEEFSPEVLDEAIIVTPDAKESISEDSSDESDLLSLDFEDVDIREVIRVLAEKSGMNMVIGPEIKAKVSIQIKDVTWEQALDVVLKTYNLTYKKEANLIRIMTLDQMRLEQEKIPLSTRIITLNFARVSEIENSLSKMLSARGSMQTNVRTNSLIVTDLPENCDKIEQIANRLDTRTPQVMIEVLMADVKLTEDDQLGIKWNVAWPTTPGEKSFTMPSSMLPSSYAATIQFGTTVLNRLDLNNTIRMWREEKRVDILAHPRVMTLDNLTAAIELVEEIPYTFTSQSSEGGTVASTSFKDAGIKLAVTPHITFKENFISLNVQVEQSFRSGWTPGDEPIIDSRKAETNLLVKDGQTIVIGGLRKKEDTVTIDKVPILGDIPFLGSFFRKTTKSLTDIDLLIFVTPNVITEPELTLKEQDRLELFSEEPTEFLESRFKPKRKIKVKTNAEIPIPTEGNFELRPPKSLGEE